MSVLRLAPSAGLGHIVKPALELQPSEHDSHPGISDVVEGTLTARPAYMFIHLFMNVIDAWLKNTYRLHFLKWILPISHCLCGPGEPPSNARVGPKYYVEEGYSPPNMSSPSFSQEFQRSPPTSVSVRLIM
jgi:hypothetical protein